MQKDIYAFVQMRMGSTRFPGKVLTKFSNGKNLFDMVTDALLRSSFLNKDNVVILTTTSSSDDVLSEYTKDKGFLQFRGSELDVWDRFYSASKIFGGELILRICGDNPFISAGFFDPLISKALKDDTIDYASYRTASGLCSILTHYGFFAEVFRGRLMSKAQAQGLTDSDRENITGVFYNNPDKYRLFFLNIPQAFEGADIRTTVDTQEDFFIVNSILEGIGHDPISPYDVLSYLRNNPLLLKRMQGSIRLNKKS